MKLTFATLERKGLTDEEILDLWMNGLLRFDGGVVWTQKPPSTWPKRFAPQVQKMQRYEWQRRIAAAIA